MVGETYFPGPYAFDPDDSSIQHSESGMVIATVSTVEDFPCRDEEIDEKFEAELVATGRLLAAAPEMAEAIDCLLSEWEKFTRYGSDIAKSANERINFARKVLAKAKGKDE